MIQERDEGGVHERRRPLPAHAHRSAPASAALKTLRIISCLSETIRNFICFVPRASATIERCKGARPRRDHVRCGVCVNCLRRGRNRDRRVGVVVDAAAAAVAP
jgi:hypothetical protein